MHQNFSDVCSADPHIVFSETLQNAFKTNAGNFSWISQKI